MLLSICYIFWDRFLYFRLWDYSVGNVIRGFESMDWEVKFLVYSVYCVIWIIYLNFFGFFICEMGRIIVVVIKWNYVC